MKLDNPRIITAKYPNIGNLAGVTNGSHNICDANYLVNLEAWEEGQNIRPIQHSWQETSTEKN
ncbi:MAG: hypothetical protein ACL7BU_08595 [Candidatus Phlomobacter fragariae]